MTQGRLRRFCHEHFLSYTRLREWRDIHDQLLDVLEERDDFKLTSAHDGLSHDQGPKTSNSRGPAQNPKLKNQNPKLAFGTPGYRAIHRSILAGLLGNVAVFDEQAGLYRATHDRQVHLFPGSVLYAKPEAKKKGRASFAKSGEDRGSPAARVARWIMAAEMVETTRLYARTAARLDPAWALDLGAHLLQVSHTEPFWRADAGRVLVKRRTRLYGLELETRAVGYGEIDPIHATEIFIREGLVGDTITWPFDFLAHNRKERDKVETILTRTRSSGYLNLDEAVYRFYAARLLPEEIPGKKSEISDLKLPSIPAGAAGVSSVPELVDLVRERRHTEPKFLQLEPEDLRRPDEAAHDAAAFPDALPIENRVLPLGYVYRPGQDEDGVTVRVAGRDAALLTPAALDWAVPGHLVEKVQFLLKALPTSQRRKLIPLAETAAAAARAVARRARLRGHQDSLAETLAGYLLDAHQLAIDPRVWSARPLPDHLRVRVEVVDEAGGTLAAGRALTEVRRQLEAQRRRGSRGSRGLAPRADAMGEGRPDGVDVWRDPGAGAGVRAGGRAGARLSGSGAGGSGRGVAAAAVGRGGASVDGARPVPVVRTAAALRPGVAPTRSARPAGVGGMGGRLRSGRDAARAGVRGIATLAVRTSGGAARRRGFCPGTGARPRRSARRGAQTGGPAARGIHVAAGAAQPRAALSRAGG